MNAFEQRKKLNYSDKCNFLRFDYFWYALNNDSKLFIE